MKRVNLPVEMSYAFKPHEPSAVFNNCCDNITGKSLLTRNMIERDIAELLEAWGELGLCRDSGRESAHKDETDAAKSCQVQPHRASKRKRFLREE